MKATALLDLFSKAGKRALLIGTPEAGAVVGLDSEGRWFAVYRGEVLHRVNAEAVSGRSTRTRYLNPGGDGLWPAPEGTTLGYQYAAGAWRVPPGLCAARFEVARSSARSAAVCAEIDLVNNRGIGLPARFVRRLSVTPGRRGLTVRVEEDITYCGRVPLRHSDALLAPWSLGQFDCGPGCEVVFPCAETRAVWDLYETPSDECRRWSGGVCRVRTDGSRRFQLGIGADVPWIEFRDPRRGLTVRRTAAPLPTGCRHIDIRDASPDVAPAKRGVRYSVYDDLSGFMEVEAAGGCPALLRPGATLSVKIATRFAVAE